MSKKAILLMILVVVFLFSLVFGENGLYDGAESVEAQTYLDQQSVSNSVSGSWSYNQFTGMVPCCN